MQDKVVVDSSSSSLTAHPRISVQAGGGTVDEIVSMAPLSTVDTTYEVVVAQSSAVCVSQSVGSGSEGKVGMLSEPTLLRVSTGL